MAKDEKTTKTETPPQQPPAPAPAAVGPAALPLPPTAAPAPPGIFDELAKLEQATTPGIQRHTLGAWARAKGVKLEQIRAAVKAGRLSGDLAGDGPEMTEAEFDEAVDFRLSNTFGELPGQRIHVPAEVARMGGTSKGLPGAELGPEGDGGGGGASGAGKREV